jgi:hypothetical protein
VAAQPVRQRQQLPARGAELPGLLLPAAPAGLAGHPDGDHDGRLPDVDPSGPLAEQRLVPDLFHPATPIVTMRLTVAAARRSWGQSEIWSAGSKRQFTALRTAPGVRLLSGIGPAKDRRRQRTAATASNTRARPARPQTRASHPAPATERQRPPASRRTRSPQNFHAITASRRARVTFMRPVARLSPAAPTTGAPLLDRLIAQGRAVPPANAGPIPPTPARDAPEEGISLSAALAEMRDDERY